MNNLVELSFDSKQFRTVKIGNEIWFVAKDVTDILGYKQSSVAVEKHCNKKGVTFHQVPTKGGEQRSICINEPNLYRLIARSRMERAVQFESWIFEEVLPSIRKTGSYSTQKVEDKFFFMKRYAENNLSVPNGHFSMLAEFFAVVVQPMCLKGGAVEADFNNVYADISMGKTFCKWLKENNVNPSDLPKYDYVSPSGKVFKANLYPYKYLGDFRTFLETIWIKEYAKNYFSKANPKLLEYLPKLLA